ncbi:hypothetical protein ACSS6W_006358 [Trichoderma asperelloides]
MQEPTCLLRLPNLHSPPTPPARSILIGLVYSSGSRSELQNKSGASSVLGNITK